ncbi:MAG: YARHG domain-containing protein [Chitinophagales bacterium]
MKYLSLLSITLLFAACTSHTAGPDADEASINSLQLKLASNNLKYATPMKEYGIEGYYTGPFVADEMDPNKNGMYANKITISIDSLVNMQVYGHSIVAGNFRPFKGSYTHEQALWTFDVSEPGDNKYDGKFSFTLMDNTIWLEGTWVANDKNLAVSSRSYKLEKRDFAYDPELALPEDVTYDGVYGSYKEDNDESEVITSDALKFNASTQLLKKEDIENMYKADLEVLRNSIYARHGYSFKNRRMRYVFDNYVDWYMPVSVDITADLTELERKNIELIKRYEVHAEKYYDVFGR